MPALKQKHLRFVFAFLLVLTIPASAFAATFTWQGPYVGAYLGGGTGNNHIFTDAGSVTSTSYFTTSADVNSVNNAGTWTKNPSTVIAGIQAGQDWACKLLVCGIAFDYTALPLNSSRTASKTYSDNSGQFSIYTSMRTNWLSTFRGRLGYPIARQLPSLFYLTGGIAMTQLKVNNTFSDTTSLAGIGSSNTSQNQFGWTAGVGVEVAAIDHLSMDFEYLYVSVPSVKTEASITNSAGGFGVPVQSKNSPLSSIGNFHANIVKIGFNYRFDV